MKKLPYAALLLGSVLNAGNGITITGIPENVAIYKGEDGAVLHAMLSGVKETVKCADEGYVSLVLDGRFYPTVISYERMREVGEYFRRRIEEKKEMTLKGYCRGTSSFVIFPSEFTKIINKPR